MTMQNPKWEIQSTKSEIRNKLISHQGSWVCQLCNVKCFKTLHIAHDTLHKVVVECF